MVVGGMLLVFGPGLWYFTKSDENGANTSATPAPEIPSTAASAPTTEGRPEYVLPSLVTVEADEGVSDEDVESLRRGIEVMDFYLNEWFGESVTTEAVVRISASPESSFTLDDGVIRATLGTGPGSELSIAEQFAEFEPFDYRTKFMAHEYVHLYQIGRGCARAGRAAEELKWFLEGEAEWLAFQAMRESGSLRRDQDVKEYLAFPLAEILPRVEPLRAYEHAEGAEMIYAYFNLAIDVLMEDRDRSTLDDYCVRVGAGQSTSEAFEDAFGVPLDDFYAEFETTGVKVDPPRPRRP